MNFPRPWFGVLILLLGACTSPPSSFIQVDSVEAFEALGECAVPGECAIAWLDLVEIGPSPGAPVEPYGAPAFSPSGLIFTGTYNPGEIAIWGADGTFVDRFGSPGEGPGEYLGTGSFQFYFYADSVFVRDQTAQLSVLDSELLFVRKTAGLPYTISVFSELLDDGSFLQSSGSPSFKVLDREGQVLAAFGPEPGVDDFGIFTSKPSGGEFWAAGARTESIERWSMGGEKLRDLRIRGSSFELGEEDDPLGSSVNALDESDGLLWRRALLKKDDPIEQDENPWRRLLEVISPVTGEVLFSRVETDPPETFVGFSQGDTAMVVRENDQGFQVVRIGRARLVAR